MNLDDFAKAIGVGRSTVIRTENGDRVPSESEIGAMARTSGLPVGFFIADLDQVLAGNEDPTLTDRVAMLESQVTALQAGLAALTADSLRRTREREAPAGTGHQQGPAAKRH